ncbi:hypothetical protein LX36DRAFT_731666 [Colletotrichum falcatum]|nr:hypothetical protein LX36DRAFT_731666 [Colletotrichum falcatum]
MKTSHSLVLFTATMAMGTLCSATPRGPRAPWQPTWEEPAAPGLGDGVEVGSLALPGRMLDESSQETCPKDTVACHLPHNWNCCPTTMPCCGPGCCAEGYRCVDARVGMCCPEGTELRDGVCTIVRQGDYCAAATTTTTGEECGGSGMVCCRGRCSWRCYGRGVWRSAAAPARGGGGGGWWWCAVVLLGTALANAAV